MCQGLGPNKHDEISEIDRIVSYRTIGMIVTRYYFTLYCVMLCNVHAILCYIILRPVHLLRVSLLRVLESRLPGDSLSNSMDIIVPTPDN